MKVFYRLSDASYTKIKLPGASKLNCLRNFVERHPDAEINLILDNIIPATFEEIEKFLQEEAPNITIINTNLGNAGSLKFSLQEAIKVNDNCYMVEDDYFHFKNIEEEINEGLEIADYVSLYDHPDKYQIEYDFGELCQVRKTKRIHWKTSISTCMTFAVNSKTLAADFDVWQKWLTGWHPHDHQIFCELNSKGRKLVTSIPGLACHLDMTYLMNKGNLDLMEKWAVDMASEFIQWEARQIAYENCDGSIENLLKLDMKLTALKNKLTDSQRKALFGTK